MSNARKLVTQVFKSRTPIPRRGTLGILGVWLLATLMLLGYYTVLPPRAQGVSSGIVISQLYGGGGNSGATFKNDFIELFNRGTATVSVAGWSVQYTSAAGTTWQVTSLSGSIAPGKYYLVQEAAGAGGTTSLPTPDATGSINMSATAGKVALVNSTTALSGACPSSSSIVDLAGFGSTANCSEGSPTPAPSNTTAVLRAANGCTDTDSNASDFSTGAPNPRNSATAANLCSNAAVTPTCPASLSTTTGSATSAGVSATDSDGIVTSASIISITPSDPGTIALAGFTAASSTGGTASATLAVSNTTPIGNYNVTIKWSNNDATPQTANCAVAVAVNGAAIAIHDIQGSGTTSPMAGSTVTTSGIVTGIRANGFFIQTPEAQYDADPNTSEGIFVFTSSTPASAAVVGNSVTVTGTVQEFIPSADPLSPPATEIAGSPTVTLISIGNSLPSAVTLTTTDTGTGGFNSGSIENLERYEGMRVKVNSLTAVAPTQSFSRGTSDEANNTSTSNGVFYGVISGVARPFREPGIQANDPAPAGSGVTIPPVPRWDFNPERIRVNSLGLAGSSAIDVTSGATITGLVGPLDYSFRTYTILQDPVTVSPAPIVSGNVSATPVPAPTSGEFAIASFNLERFYDTTDDSSTSDVVMTSTGFNNRLSKASLAIRNVLRFPDILGVEEMENLATLQTLATRISSDAIAASQPDPQYVAYLSEGNDVGGIDVGFLVKTATVSGSMPRVMVNTVVQEGKTTLFTNPDSSTELLNDRPSLRLMAVINNSDGRTFPITVIVNHLRSLNDVDNPGTGSNGWSTIGARVREKRKEQAEFLASLIQARQIADPNEHIISIGDYNAFQVSDGYVDSIGTIKGTPAPATQVVVASSDLVNPDLVDLVDFAASGQAYSFSFDGTSQVLDHELITGNLLAAFSHLNFARNNADFPESYRSDSTRPERISDHDMPVAYFSFPCVMTCPANIMQASDINQCGALVSYSLPAGSSNCAQVICAPASGVLFAVGTTTVTCAETGGGGSSCSFTITVNDTQPPAITCPESISKQTDPQQCTAVVTYSAPAVTDNCGSPSTPLCNPSSSSTFPKGTTTVSCTVNDGHGNQANCGFTVTVSDGQPPTITCPANVVRSTDPGQCSAVVAYPAPAVNDNCMSAAPPQKSLIAFVPACSPASGSTFPKGTTTVICTVLDDSNNQSSCRFSVTVNDTQAPVFAKSPPNVYAAAPVSCPIATSAAVSYGYPTATDNCNGAVVVSCSPPTGSVFAVGTSTVNCTATDASGAAATCSFQLTLFSLCLVDNSNPGNVVLFNTATGDYHYCCGGVVVASGRGILTVRGCVITIDSVKGSRRVRITADASANSGAGAGSALIQRVGITSCTIADKSMAGNACNCN